MTPSALLTEQATVHAFTQSRSQELGFDPTKVEPIYDGVVDAEGYLASSPRLMWILKEPYDDFDAEGMPTGGGWTMFKDFGEGDTLAKAVNRNAALRNVTYASYAILNGVASYAELPWITDKPQEYEKAIRSIAYCNIGKMPGKTTTSSAHLLKLYQDWKDILFQQIDLYDPDIIIVCGTATLQVLSNDMDLDLSMPTRKIDCGNSDVHVHEWRGKRLLWAPHPAARITPGDWVESVVAAASGSD